MKIPKGMTEKEVLRIIDKIAERYAYKFRFGYFEADDIRQEAKIIAMEALSRYDETRPLENFLAVHVKNRLNNFKRDKYYRQTKTDSNTQEQHNNSKKYLMEPLDISNIRDEDEQNMRVADGFVKEFEEKEIFNIINETLDVDLRGDYLRMRDGCYVPKPRREKILEEINNILRENGYEEGQIF